MAQQSPQHLGEKDRRLYWDWWRENPVEIVLVLLILVLFVAVPWQGCGISEVEPEDDEQEELQIDEVVP